MKLVVLDQDTLGYDLDFSALDALCEVTRYPNCDSTTMAEYIRDADIIVANKPRFCEETLRTAEKLKLICLTSTGYNNCDLDYLKQRHIALCNIPAYSTQSVVQHTFAMLFTYMEKISRFEHLVHTRSYLEGDLYGMVPTRFFELQGRTFGIIGLGAIGKRVAQVAEAFGCRVVYASTTGKNNCPDYEQLSLDDLLAQSDIVSIHCPLNEQTKNLLTKTELAKMKPHSVLINVSRGGIVNEADLVDALKAGTVGGACIDVFEQEPIAADSPYLTMENYDNLILTPHIAWGAVQSRQRCIDKTVENVQNFLNGIDHNRIV